jgi:hypothetical protein
MTPEQERALLEAATAGLDDDVRAAYAELVELIRGGMTPRDAVQQVMESFSDDMASTMSTALSAIMDAAIGTEATLAIQVGAVQLSRRLYSEAVSVGETVHTIVQNHARGFADARRLALDLFDGYGFREPGAEPLQIDPSNPKLPKYMREALLDDGQLRRGFARAYARQQVDGLSTPALRAAYSEALEAISGLDAGRGAAVLEKRLEVAFYERVRYFAARIAQTELHRAYLKREALLLMDDADVQFVQVRRAPGRQLPCICVLFTGRDRYGMGPGVYPKALAPLPPYHPHCRCILSPRLDLTGKKAKPENEEADVYFLRRLGDPVASRVMGSRAKLGRVLAGNSADATYNSSIAPAYQVRKVGEAA